LCANFNSAHKSPYLCAKPVYVEIKFTNNDYNYPVVCDKFGPSETGKTYLSPDGSSGSWEDLGSNNVDAAIRMRFTTGNVPPTAPTITGPSSGNEDTELYYDFQSTDYDEDKISYYIEWGDDEITDWTSFRISGLKLTASHIWDEEGGYTIKAKARDIYGAESRWSEKQIEIPRTKIFRSQFFRLLSECFPNTFLIIRYILE